MKLKLRNRMNLNLAKNQRKHLRKKSKRRHQGDPTGSEASLLQTFHHHLKAL